MSLAYTAPTWTDGFGTGISASQMQSISDCLQGLVQGSDKAVHHITFSGSTATFTYADGSQQTFSTNIKGISSIVKTGTAGLIDTYTLTYSDGTTFAFTITNGLGISNIYNTSSSEAGQTVHIVYTDGTEDTFYVRNGKSAYQGAQEAGYSGTEEQFYTLLGSVQGYAINAERSAQDAAISKTNAGTSETNAKDSEDNAAESEQNAATSETNANTSALNAEAWAVGQRNGSDVGSSDETYHNNSKYYSTEAASSASDASDAATTCTNIKTEVQNMIEMATFSIDFTTGELIYSKDDVYNFSINTTTGNLEWEVLTA